jgi:hypothetical protein
MNLVFPSTHVFFCLLYKGQSLKSDNFCRKLKRYLKSDRDRKRWDYHKGRTIIFLEGGGNGKFLNCLQRQKSANKLFADIEKRKKIVCKLMRLCNINQGFNNNEQSAHRHTQGLHPKSPGMGDAGHISNLRMVININLLNTVIFRYWDKTLCSVNNERTSIRAFFNIQAGWGKCPPQNHILPPPPPKEKSLFLKFIKTNQRKTTNR